MDMGEARGALLLSCGGARRKEREEEGRGGRALEGRRWGLRGGRSARGSGEWSWRREG